MRYAEEECSGFTSSQPTVYQTAAATEASRFVCHVIVTPLMGSIWLSALQKGEMAPTVVIYDLPGVFTPLRCKINIRAIIQN